MNRITPTQVKNVYGAEVQETPCGISIDTAKIYLDKIPAGSLPDATLTIIWMYLAAHFYSISYPKPVSESGGGITTSYPQPVVGKGLRSTVFGQQACTLDTTETLAAGTGAPVFFFGPA
jgi:hypothetical protein